MSSEQGDELLEIGTEAWFATLVKFLCGGLDPFCDCNHVSNKEVTTMFGEKLKCSGYQYFKAKAEDVKLRFEELYLVVYQSKKMPRKEYVTLSFVRAVLSEICHHNRMNWTLFAFDRWAQKKICYKKSDAILNYKEEDMTKSYDHAIPLALKRAMDKEAEELGKLDIELEKTLATCNELERRSTQHSTKETT